MAVSTPTSKITSQSASAATSFATASWTPTDGALYLVSVTTRTAASDPNIPTLSGNGQTWTQIDSQNYDNAGSQKRVSLFRCLAASSSAGTLTADFAGQSQSDCVIVVDEISSGFDTGGTNGSGAIVQSAKNADVSGTGTTLTATLAAFGSTNNATYGTFAIGNGTGTSTAGTGFTKVGEQATASNLRLMTEFRSDNDTTVDGTSSVSAELGMIAIEIKASGAGSTLNLRMLMGMGT